jgi:uncharacterized membrane protein
MSVRNIIAICFVQDSLAFEAFTGLQLLDAEHQIGLGEAAILERGEDDHVFVKDIATTRSETTSVLKILLASLAKPLDVTIDTTAGSLPGDLDKIGGPLTGPSGLSAISSSVRRGETAVLADVSEPSKNVIDREMGRLGGQLTRIASTEIESALAAVSPSPTRARLST